MKHLSVLFLILVLIFTMSCNMPTDSGSGGSGGGGGGSTDPIEPGTPGLKIFTNLGSISPISNPATSTVTAGTGTDRPGDVYYTTIAKGFGTFVPDKIYYESSKAVMLYSDTNGQIDFGTTITFNNSNATDYFTFMYQGSELVPVRNLYNQVANPNGYSATYNMLVVDYEDSFVVFDSFSGYDWVANDANVETGTKIVFIDSNVFHKAIGLYSTELYTGSPRNTNIPKIWELISVANGYTTDERTFIKDIADNNIVAGAGNIDLGVENMLIIPVDGFSYTFPGNINDVSIELKIDYNAVNAWAIDKPNNGIPPAVPVYEYFVQPGSGFRPGGTAVEDFRKAPLGEFIHEKDYDFPRSNPAEISPKITVNLAY